jgi:uncharacterized protein
MVRVAERLLVPPTGQNGCMTSTRVTTLEQLRELYREPSTLVRSKVKSDIDDVSRAFLQHAPFALVATADRHGRVDVSPRGGPAGFLRVFEDGTVGIPDLNGNNLLDTLSNIIATGRAAMIVIHPGKEETLRVNGRAHISIDPEVLGAFTDELRPPKSAIIIEPDEVFIHCAKAFRRGNVWSPEKWSTAGPDGVDILLCQLDLKNNEAELRQSFAEGYVEELALD